jgi:hypothetical protein
MSPSVSKMRYLAILLTTLFVCLFNSRHTFVLSGTVSMLSSIFGGSVTPTAKDPTAFTAPKFWKNIGTDHFTKVLTVHQAFMTATNVLSPQGGLTPTATTPNIAYFTQDSTVHKAFTITSKILVTPTKVTPFWYSEYGINNFHSSLLSLQLQDTTTTTKICFVSLVTPTAIYSWSSTNIGCLLFLQSNCDSDCEGLSNLPLIKLKTVSQFGNIIFNYFSMTNSGTPLSTASSPDTQANIMPGSITSETPDDEFDLDYAPRHSGDFMETLKFEAEVDGDEIETEVDGDDIDDVENPSAVPPLFGKIDISAGIKPTPGTPKSTPIPPGKSTSTGASRTAPSGGSGNTSNLGGSTTGGGNRTNTRTAKSPGNISFGGAAFKFPTAADKTKVREYRLGAFTETVDEAYREALSGKSLFEFHKLASAGIEKKFSYDLTSINPEQDSDFLKNNDLIMGALNEIQKHLKSYHMEPVFNVFLFTREDKFRPQSGQISILSNFDKTNEHHVGMSNQIWGEFALSHIHAQSLSWSQEYLLNCCDATLRDDIENRLLAIPIEHQGGPIVYHLIMTSLVSCTFEASRHIVNRLQAMSVRDYPGENILQFAATFQNAAMRLRLNGHFPSDIASLFMNRLRTCSVTDFIRTLEFIEHTPDDSCSWDYHALRVRMLRRYNDLILSNRWLPYRKPNQHINASLTESAKERAKEPPKKIEPLPKDASGKEIPLTDISTPPGPNQPDTRRNKACRFGRQWFCPLCPNTDAPTNKGRWGNHSKSHHREKPPRNSESHLATTTPGTAPPANNSQANAATTPPVVPTVTPNGSPTASATTALVGSATPLFT